MFLQEDEDVPSVYRNLKIFVKRPPGSVWNCLWGHTLKRSHGINRKSMVLYPGLRFLSSATWPSLPKKHYNGLINQTMKAIAPIFPRPVLYKKTILNLPISLFN